MSPVTGGVTVSLTLTEEERTCLLRAARRRLNEDAAEALRLTELEQRGIHGADIALQMMQDEMSCINNVVRKLWLAKP